MLFIEPHVHTPFIKGYRNLLKISERGLLRTFCRKGEVFKKGEDLLENGLNTLAKFFEPIFFKFLGLQSLLG